MSHQERTLMHWCRRVNHHNHLGNCPTISINPERSYTLRPSTPTARYMPRRNAYTFTRSRVHSNDIAPDSKRPRFPSVVEWKTRLWYSHRSEYETPMKMSQPRASAWMRSVLSAEGKHPDAEGCIWCDLVCMKFKNRQPRSWVSDFRVGWQGGDWRGCRGRGRGAGNILFLGLAAGYDRCVDVYDLSSCYLYAILQEKCLLRNSSNNTEARSASSEILV